MSPPRPRSRARARPDETPLGKRGLDTLHGVGPRITERLAAIGIRSVEDLLFHLPLRYQDRTRVHPIGSLRAGEEVLIRAEVQLTQVRYGRRRSLVCMVADGTGSLTLRFFHFTQRQREGLARGAPVSCFGEVRQGPQGLEMVHPEYRVAADDAPVAVAESLTPVYPTTEGLTQRMLASLTDQALAALERGAVLEELLPEVTLGELRLPRLDEALCGVHRPPPETRTDALLEGTHPWQRRLAFEELLAHHLSLRALRAELDGDAAPRIEAGGELVARFLDGLGFELTGAQLRVAGEIATDLARDRPMHRLAQGDVGCGKTVVAALAALAAVDAGYQAALMAPTELLAEQHLRTFDDWLDPLGVEIAWLSGRLTARARREALGRIEHGDARLVIGTHALFQQEVRFERLGLVIVDEQHRFGVDQRLALRAKGVHDDLHPHQLIMTATPIPRTLAMTAYADLDTSVIDELPPGRVPVETAVVSAERRAEVVERIRDVCTHGLQAYWVCTLIEDSDTLEAQAAGETAALLAEALPELRVALVHGRMKAAEKDEVMRAFKAAEVDLLVATTVIEVGVDVPNASLMIIENAERLGLAQLHQLRGRVGRGARRSVCLMLYQRPLSQSARARLRALRETTDGFVIAQRDLELRGPGEVLGTRQTGLPGLRVADLARDRDLVPGVERAARELLEHTPERAEPLTRRWIGDAVRYRGV